MALFQLSCPQLSGAWIGARLLAVVLLAQAGAAHPAAAQTAKNSGNWLPEILSPPAASKPKPKPAPPSPAEKRRHLLDDVHSWGYQLRLIRFPEIAASPLDLVVIDHALSAGRRFVHQFAPELIDHAKLTPNGQRRIVLAYLSIGEAERYRFYWDQAWYDPARKPSWLGALNPEWDGNYIVRFWDPGWQRIILEGPDSYLAHIKSAGFDGIYIDRADVHSEWLKEKPDAEALMAEFIRRLATAARADAPRFLIIMQNAEELVRRKSVLDVIDGIAKEDLYYGIDHKAGRNDRGNVEDSLRYLRQAKRSGRRILVVEYLDEEAKVSDVRRRSAAEGFVLHVTGRDLGDLSVISPDRLVPQLEAPQHPGK